MGRQPTRRRIGAVTRPLNPYPDTMRRNALVAALMIGLCILGAAALLIGAVLVTGFGQARLMACLANWGATP